jgi:iron(III) transport system substrate-binding protein
VQVVYPNQDGDGTLVMPTTIVLMKGPNRQNGRTLVDFLVSADVEQQMSENGHVPLRPGAHTPPGMPSLERVRAMPVDYAHLGDVIERIQPMLRRWSGM